MVNIVIPVSFGVLAWNHFPGINASEVTKEYIITQFVSLIGNGVTGSMDDPGHAVVHDSVLEVHSIVGVRSSNSVHLYDVSVLRLHNI